MTRKEAQLRVAHVVWGYLGGGVDSVLDSYLMADVLRPESVISHVVVIRKPGKEEQKTPKASGGYSLIEHGVQELWQAARSAAECLLDFAPDIVLLHGFNATIFGFVLRRRLPMSLPIVSSYHGQYFARSLKGRARAALFNWLELNFFRSHASAIIAVSHYSAVELQAHNVPAEKIFVLHNAVAKGSPPLPQRSHSNASGQGDEVKLITVARLVPEKGIDTLLRAFASLMLSFPKVKLDIVGDGPLRKELVAYVKEHGMGCSVRLLGNRNDVGMLLSQADVFVLTSRQENHSVAILEAMRAGLPLVVSDVGGNTESVRDGQEGYIVPGLDASATAAALSRLVASGELRAHFAASAIARYESEFESAIMVDRLLNFLTSLATASREIKHG